MLSIFLRILKIRNWLLSKIDIVSKLDYFNWEESRRVEIWYVLVNNNISGY